MAYAQSSLALYLQTAYTFVFILILYYFNAYLYNFFESRPIPNFWNFFYWGLWLFWFSDCLIYLVYLTGIFNSHLISFSIFFNLITPPGLLLSIAGVYQILKGDEEYV